MCALCCLMLYICWWELSGKALHAPNEESACDVTDRNVRGVTRLFLWPWHSQMQYAYSGSTVQLD